MAHEITVYRPGIDAKALAKVLKIHEQDDEDWVDRYEAYLAATVLASLSRAAGNPLNSAIYIALGVMEEAYGGSSGTGIAIPVTIQQFETAKEILEKRDFSNLPLERNAVHDLVDSLKKTGATVHSQNYGGDVSREIAFVSTCINYLNSSRYTSLPVHFT